MIPKISLKLLTAYVFLGEDVLFNLFDLRAEYFTTKKIFAFISRHCLKMKETCCSFICSFTIFAKFSLICPAFFLPFSVWATSFSFIYQILKKETLFINRLMLIHPHIFLPFQSNHNSKFLIEHSSMCSQIQFWSLPGLNRLRPFFN